MHMDPALSRLATSRGMLAILFWSSSTALMRSITASLGALFGSACIYTLSTLLIIALQPRTLKQHFSRRYLLGGGVLFVLYEVLLSQAIGRAESNLQSIEVGLINYAWPCLTILFAVWCGLQKSSLPLWIGAILSFIGIFWGVSGAQWSVATMLSHVQSNPLSYVLALIAAVLWGIYCNIARLYGQGQNGVWFFFLCISVWLWGMWWWTGAPVGQWHWQVAAEVVVMSLFTGLGYLFWDTGIQKGNMTLLAILSYFIPLISTLIASWWLSQPLTITFWQSVGLVTLGSLVCWYGSQARNRIRT